MKAHPLAAIIFGGAIFVFTIIWIKTCLGYEDQEPSDDRKENL